ncbi:hypothetical protein [Nostoc sp.]
MVLTCLQYKCSIFPAYDQDLLRSPLVAGVNNFDNQFVSALLWQ